ncbi:hypothetical protein PPYR_09011 [Photinus pyralis]|uniref:Inosine/uridine-preferring nucleoside hydrolase domain-containing protein n=1 Tax=Photinus pyralis TaxID=7054 RepID=A0A1Y1KNG3_PHOPY|nr:uncharacterized protein C1683.06c-like [Photinus pyralis]XP_031343715.1 uncharacterized protein C1683.06c-like [Photinus pyralis]XP_031352451.1 uncharacterized protein C1683.06c-like [Photinus pyralis]KAB0792941.1 hypothetical protein PPYR_12561 [Photinus pyralis]KAB0798018.1 hypothetical protein PPYR_09011 [Photinus pyralis]
MLEIKHIIIDTDPGIDDLHAILMFLAAEKRNEVKIVAITVTAGNTDVNNGCRNVVSLLEKACRTDIPVYKGASKNLISEDCDFLQYYGRDGLGNTGYANNANLDILRDEPSSLAIRRLVKENRGLITLVCLGPLTNIALAAKTDDDFYMNLKEIFIMGGTIRGKGNVTLMAEFNFYFDPESVYSFLHTVTCPTTILPFEPVLEVALPATWRFEVLPNLTPEMKFLTAAEKSFYKFKNGGGGKDVWTSADGCLALIVLHPEAVLRSCEYHMSIELHGKRTRGQCILDHTKERKSNVTVVEEISQELLVNALIETHSRS